MSRGVRGAVLALVLAGASGCTLAVGNLGMVTTRSFDGGPPASPVIARGRDCFRLITVVPMHWPPNLGLAVENALDASGRRMLSDAALRFRFFYVPFVYGEACYEVEGWAS